MAVEVTVTGTSSYAGVTTNLTDYSVVEDATPLDPASNNGGVGQLTTSIVENPSAKGTITLIDDVLTLSDGAKGTTTATVTGIDASNGIASLTADSRMSVLLSTRSASPQFLTMEQTFRYYLGLAGITTGIVFEAPGDSSYRYSANLPIPTPGWTDVIFDKLRQFAIVCGAEISLVSNNIVFRPLRTRVAESRRDTAAALTVKRGQIARAIEVVYYQNSYKVNGQVYPKNGVWTEDTPVYQVDAGETLEVNIPVSASLLSIIQPTCVAYVGRYDTGSVYSVVGQDGLAIVPAQWTRNGGSVKVAIGEDPATIDLTITGAQTTQGPFRIAVGAGTSDAYSSLRLQGTGTYFDKQTLTIPTGVPDSDTPQRIGITVDNPYISTIADAYDLGIRTAGRYSGYEQSLSVSSTGINRADVSNNLRYPTFTEFGAGVDGKAPVWNGQTFDAFNATWAGKTFDDFNAYYYEVVRSDFANQAFGNIAGARRRFRDAFYRIDTATTNPTGVNYSATSDTVFNDFRNTWQLAVLEDFVGPGITPKTTAYTFDDFAAIQAGRSFNDFNMTPLWRTYAGLSSAES